MLACVFPKFQAYLNSCSVIVPKSRGEHERLFQTTSCTEMHPQLTAAPGTQPLGGCGSAVRQLPARLPGEIKPSVGETPLKMSEKGFAMPCDALASQQDETFSMGAQAWSCSDGELEPRALRSGARPY